ncbi:MAG: leucine-rich repeat protein [Eubacterium sp.]|nr:leucine-rich repeat protein [Eubacterium sp.]
MRNTRRIFPLIVVLIILFFLPSLSGCHGKADNGIIYDDSADESIYNEQGENISTSSQAVVETEAENISEEIDYEELINRSVLQYPSSDDQFKYNVYKDSVTDNSFVEITGYSVSKEEAQVITELEIPDQIDEKYVLSVSGFSNCTNLSSVVFPNKLMNIGNDAFKDCAIIDLDLPDSVQYINDYGFFRNKLASLRCPKNLKRIGDKAFGDNKLVDIVTNDKLEAIGERAFAFNWTQIDELVLPESLQSISSQAFFNTGIKDVYIKSMDVSIGTEVFEQANIEEKDRTNTVYHAYPGSSVATYCAENNYTFVVLEN